MKGYKVFNPDWTCRGFQYKVGETYHMEGEIECCYRGFHFSKKPLGCFRYYTFDPRNKVAEVEILGEISTRDNNIYCTNAIKIMKKLSWEEVLELVNVGVGNTGYDNTGNHNSGNYNSGENNSGNYNSGSSNHGNYNVGSHNIGDRNTGNYNSGDFNCGDWNSGNWNSGSHNLGDYNSGDHNSGNRNSGNYNSGKQNYGLYNSGDHNSGDGNSGYWNRGNHNSGNFNCGDWNSGDFNSGIFNTESPKVTMFDAPTDWTFDDWVESIAYRIMSCAPFDHYECQQWWNHLRDEERETVASLPNFDATKFEICTGIRIKQN